MEPKTVSETRLRLAQTMTPNDANVLGKVFGGSILALIDLTASAVSSRFAGTVCVTAAFDRVDFLQPVEIGELVELDGLVSYVGRTSVEVTIDVYATNLVRNERRHVNTARVTMVAMRDGKPSPVPRLLCETREEQLAFLEGRLRRELRAERSAQMKGLYAKLEGLDDGALAGVLASERAISDQLS